MSLERVRLGRVLRTDMSSERVRLGQQLLNERLPKRGTCCQHCIANSGEPRKDELPLFFSGKSYCQKRFAFKPSYA